MRSRVAKRRASVLAVGRYGTQEVNHGSRLGASGPALGSPPRKRLAPKGREMTMRTCTAEALAVAALAALPAGAGAKGFSYGVTSSEVTASSALVWTRADKAGKVTLVVSPDKKFGNKGDKSKKLSAKKAADNVVQVTVRGLKAGHRYAYVFTSGKNKSAVGHFKTARKASQPKPLRFAYSGDADAQKAAGATKPFYNTFQVYKQ